MRKNLNNIEEVKEKDKENEDRKNFYPHFSYYFLTSSMNLSSIVSNNFPKIALAA